MGHVGRHRQASGIVSYPAISGKAGSINPSGALEPTTMALGGLGLAALMLFRRKKRTRRKTGPTEANEGNEGVKSVSRLCFLCFLL